MTVWSKVNKSAEKHFAPSVAQRVSLHVTSYRSTDDDAGRGYIIVDGKIVWDMCTEEFWRAECKLVAKLAAEFKRPSSTVQGLAHSQLLRLGIM